MLKSTRTLSLLGVVLLSMLSLITTGCNGHVTEVSADTAKGLTGDELKTVLQVCKDTPGTCKVTATDSAKQIAQSDNAGLSEDQAIANHRSFLERAFNVCLLSYCANKDEKPVGCNCYQPAPQHHASGHIVHKPAPIQQAPTVTVIQTNNNGAVPQQQQPQQQVQPQLEPVQTAQTWDGTTPVGCMVNGVNECIPHNEVAVQAQPASYGYYPPYDQQVSQWNVGLVWVEGRGYCRRQDYPRERPRQPRQPSQPQPRPNPQPRPVTCTSCQNNGSNGVGGNSGSGGSQGGRAPYTPPTGGPVTNPFTPTNSAARSQLGSGLRVHSALSGGGGHGRR